MMKGLKGSNKYATATSSSSVSRSGTGVPSNFAVTMSTLLVACMLFLFSTYYFHLRISMHPHQDGNMQKGGFVFNRIHGFNASKADNSTDFIEVTISHIQIREAYFQLTSRFRGYESKKRREKILNFISIN